MSFLVAFVSLSLLSGPSDVMHCAKNLSALDKPGEVIDYKGVRYWTCCTVCGGHFIEDPDKFLKADAAAAGSPLYGVSLFDPVSGLRIEGAAKTPASVYKGIRYYFDGAAEKKRFDAHPAKFTAPAPAKELLQCPVEKDVIPNYAAAGGFVDFKGVRYYVCCASCIAPMRKDAAKFVGDYVAKATVAKPEAVAIPKPAKTK